MTATEAAHTVALPGYTVTIAPGALDALGDTLRSVRGVHRWAVVTDAVVASLYLDRVIASIAAELGPPVRCVIPSGEAFKTRETWASVTDQLLAAGLGRDAGIVALGGGVVGDLAGFVAATFMRGLPVVQLPTTLLAMVDASVGGKTGVDTPAGKNLVGAFHPPAAVVADPETLATLSPAHLRAGLAEAIKHGVIADAAYFERIAAALPALWPDPRDPVAATPGADPVEALAWIVARSVEIKAAAVRIDEREGGFRKTLNFGHTLGHAIEHASGYALLHGEAVAIGMVLEARLAERVGVADPGTAGAIERVVRRAGLPHRLPSRLAAEEILRLTRLDKKAREGRAEYALPARVGAMAGEERGWGIPVEDEAVIAILHEGMEGGR